MNIERVAEVIRKAKAVLPHLSEETRKTAIIMISVMEDNYKIIKEQDIPCPPELENRLETAFKVIENLYDATATN